MCALMESRLKIPIVEEYVHLGCTIEERTHKHRVHYSVELNFAGLPAACMTDAMEKTPCYKEIADLLSLISKEKHYATIEHLGYTAMNALKKYSLSFTDLKTTQITFSVHKLNPPVEQIKSGSVFSLVQQL